MKKIVHKKLRLTKKVFSIPYILFLLLFVVDLLTNVCLLLNKVLLLFFVDGEHVAILLSL